MNRIPGGAEASLVERDLAYLPLPNRVEVVLDGRPAPSGLTRTAFVPAFLEGGEVVMAVNRRRGPEIPGGHIDPGSPPRLLADGIGRDRPGGMELPASRGLPAILRRHGVQHGLLDVRVPGERRVPGADAGRPAGRHGRGRASEPRPARVPPDRVRGGVRAGRFRDYGRADVMAAGKHAEKAMPDLAEDFPGTDPARTRPPPSRPPSRTAGPTSSRRPRR